MFHSQNRFLKGVERALNFYGDAVEQVLEGSFSDTGIILEYPNFRRGTLRFFFTLRMLGCWEGNAGGERRRGTPEGNTLIEYLVREIRSVPVLSNNLATAQMNVTTATSRLVGFNSN